ncbi:MAG: MscS Mechanosensitive ion channel [Gemmatimonadetes bacterium]|nr:MscS Mechanosensitive ion channel [Gemmatimonadota bacterium]
MWPRHGIIAAVVVGFLVLAGYGLYRTGQELPRAVDSASAKPSQRILTEDALLAAQRLVRLPTTASELPFAEEAFRLADQEMDLEFADAVRDATANPQPMTPDAQVAQEHLRHVEQDRIKDSALVAKLEATGASKHLVDMAKARLEIDTDEMDDATNDLSRAGGDPQSRIQAMTVAHQAGSRNADTTQIKVAPPIDAEGLVQAAKSYLALSAKEQQLQQARAAAVSAGVSLTAQHETLEKKVGHAEHDTAHLSLEDEQQKALEQKARSITGQRGFNQQQLAVVYSKWLGTVRTQERALVNRILRDVVLILSIVLVLLLLDSLLMRVLAVMSVPKRSAQRLRVVTRVSLQALGVLLILIVIFGVPNNLGTIIGLATAGLTVALKDFIVAFVGWLVLMGRHGIRIGDLVEINGVTGEVVELGMFNTVLHETGNWTDSSHPTGRRVTFTNSYAIEGHYFNFSTSGQWLWDEVRIDIPAGRNPYPVVEALRTQAEAVTAESARLAQQEWTGVHRSPGVTTITSAPAITIKPVMGGVEITLRYITHAAERYEVRAKLYRAAVEILGEVPATSATTA